MTSKRHLVSSIEIGLMLLAGVLAFGQSPSAPAWLVGYPGAVARNQTTPRLLESSYETEAKPGDVIAHYRKLFETAGLDFHPNFDGVGTSIRGKAAEGELLILIRPQGKGTAVQVDVAAPTAAPAPVAPPARERVTRVEPSVREQSGREHVQNMEKYDQPMRPPRRPPPPVLVWPAWLTHVDGERLQIEKGVDRVGLKTLECRYASYAERNAIEAYYAELFAAHGFTVRSRSMASWPAKNAAWVEGSDHALGEGPRTDIRVEVTPVGETRRVDIRMTARP